MHLVTVDPGLNHCGVACWHEGILIDARLVRAHYEPGMERGEKWRTMASLVAQQSTIDALLVIEVPQVYTRQHSKGDPNDLIDIAGVVGAITMQATSVEWSPLPHDWKGNLPKDITAVRVMNALKPGEHKAIKPCPPSLLHNVYDAIHLGLVYLKREGLRG